MQDLSITLFGTPQIKHGENQIPLQRRKDLALFVYLVVTARAHPRDILAALFWPESDQSVSRANLRKNLSRLKSYLGDGVLLVDQDRVSLNPGLVHWMDTSQFQSLTDRPRNHNHFLQNGDQSLCEDCQTALEEAVELYRGDFLEGFTLPDSPTFEEWHFFQAEGYRQRLGEALQYLTVQYMRTERYAQAIEYGKRWLVLDVLHEPAHRQLMLAYAYGGQQSAALRQFAECVRLLKEEIGVEPEPETIEIHDAIRKKSIGARAGKFANRAPSARKIALERSSDKHQKTKSNLPIHPTPFLGRAKELGELKNYMEDPSSRVVTLLGPGGSGKTRLATQTGFICNQENIFEDGIYFIQLAPLTEPSSMAPVIQKELGIPASPDHNESNEQLLQHLGKRKILLILDNLEHLISPIAISLVSAIIRNAESTKILITSRERLNLQGEHIFPVEGLTTPSNPSLLSIPETAPDTTNFDAIQLFEQSAKRVQPSFKVTRENIWPISQICYHIQGMPLAIELAASWVEVLSVEDIYKEIKADLDFLQSELHDVPDRQRSLRAIFDSSWGKLSKPTRSSLKALSVFRAKFSRAAAHSIAGISVKTLLELTNKSWIQPQPDGRYLIHELLRQFAFEKLECDSITYEQIQDQYCAYYSNRLSVLWQLMKGSNQAVVFSEMETEFENIRTTWNWLVEKRDFETAVDDILPALFSYSEPRGKAFALIDMADRMLKAMGGSKSKKQIKAEIILRTVRGAFFADGFPIRESDYEGVYPIDRDNIRQAWDLFKQLITIQELGFWGVILAFIYGIIIDQKTAIQFLQKIISNLEENGTVWELSTAKLHLAQLLLEFKMDGSSHSLESINQLLIDALNGFNSIGNKIESAHTLRQLGNLQLEYQDLHEAIKQWRSAHALLLDPDVDEWSTASNINWLIGDAYLQLGQFDNAFKCFQDIAHINFEKGYLQQTIGALSKESFEKARYGDLEDALKIRRQCLELVNKTGPDYQIAWNKWEMGELMRLFGRTGESNGWFEQAREKFENYQDNIGLSFYWRGKGDLASLDKDWNLANQCFSKGLELAEIAQHNWIKVYLLNGLGKVAFETSDIQLAEKYMTNAIILARKVHDPGITLAVLVNITQLLTRKNKSQRAVELGTLILKHFAGWNETKTLAEALLLEIKRTMLPREYKELKKKGEELDLWKTVDETISEMHQVE